MKKCLQCNIPMEVKGRMPQEGSIGTIVLCQCPICKKVELVEKRPSSWCRLDYP